LQPRDDDHGAQRGTGCPRASAAVNGASEAGGAAAEQRGADGAGAGGNVQLNQGGSTSGRRAGCLLYSGQPQHPAHWARGSRARERPATLWSRKTLRRREEGGGRGKQAHAHAHAVASPPRVEPPARRPPAGAAPTHPPSARHYPAGRCCRAHPSGSSPRHCATTARHYSSPLQLAGRRLV
jgi:hypothetical protein